MLELYHKLKMGHDRKKRTHNAHTQKSDSLSDIIPMSNDDSKNDRSNNELDDYDDDNDVSDNDDDSSDNDDNDDDEYSSDNDDNDDDEEYKSKKYDRKGRRHHEHEDDSDFSAATIKPKRSKPGRKSKVSTDGINEVERTKGVQKLSDKLNNNLHQIQIALPYNRTPQPYPETTNNGYKLIDAPKKKIPFWKKRLFSLIMKVIIGICVFVCFGVFLYKYLKMAEELNKRHHDIDSEKGEIKANKHTDVLTDENNETVSSVAMTGGNENSDDSDDGEYNLSDNVYNSFGKTTTQPKKRYYENRSGKVCRSLPKRDARGRFIKNKNSN